jgi:putative restriction endonuclease
VATGKKWSREELLVALNLYHKLAFGQLHGRQPAIIALAEKMGRGANSVAMKLSNFASLDESLKLRGIRGLQGASALDRQTWTEFHENAGDLVPASEEAFRKLFDAGDDDEVEVVPKLGVRVSKRPPAGPTETTRTTKTRRGQSYFRDVVLNNYDNKCGISGLDLRGLLVASHILPWADHEAERLNVRNGICLSRLHDAAFDQRLIAFDDDLRLLLSRRLKQALSKKMINDAFAAFEGEPLNLPQDAVPPDPEFLGKHRALFARAA